MAKALDVLCVRTSYLSAKLGKNVLPLLIILFHELRMPNQFPDAYWGNMVDAIHNCGAYSS